MGRAGPGNTPKHTVLGDLSEANPSQLIVPRLWLHCRRGRAGGNLWQAGHTVLVQTACHMLRAVQFVDTRPRKIDIGGCFNNLQI